jgi:hypothetical protein
MYAMANQYPHVIEAMVITELHAVARRRSRMVLTKVLKIPRRGIGSAVAVDMTT